MRAACPLGNRVRSAQPVPASGCGTARHDTDNCSYGKNRRRTTRKHGLHKRSSLLGGCFADTVAPLLLACQDAASANRLSDAQSSCVLSKNVSAVEVILAMASSTDSSPVTVLSHR